MAKRATALYLRVSTAQQVGDERFGLAVQQRIAEQYAAMHSLSITRIYQDVVTGTRASREQLERLLDEAEQYEVVLVSGVDRLARRTSVAYALLEELSETGAEVHSADMGVVDMNDEGSAMNFGIRSLFAESDHRRIAKRLRAGIHAKVRSGKPVSPLRSYGWKNSEIVEEEAQWIRWSYDFMLHGGTLHTLAAALNERGLTSRTGQGWTVSSTYRVLTNPIYKGLYIYGRRINGPQPAGRTPELVTCQVEAIVTPQVWEAVQRNLQSRNHGGKAGTSKYAPHFPLRGRIRCSECDHALSPQPRSGVKVNGKSYEYFAYQCSYARKAKRVTSGIASCTHKKLYSAKKLNAFVLQQLQNLLLNDEALSQAVTHPAPKPIDNKGAVAAVENRLKNLKLLALDGGLSPVEYRETRQELETQRERLLAPQNIIFVPPDIQQAKLTLTQALELENLAEIAARLDLRVTVHPGGQVDIMLNAL